MTGRTEPSQSGRHPDYRGLRVVTSPYAPKGTAYIIDEAALFRTPPKLEFSEPRWSPTFDRQRYTLMAEMRVAFQPAVIERDPLERYGLPRSLRAWWRLACALVGYEYRKASGTLRRYPRARHSIITGLTS